MIDIVKWMNDFLVEKAGFRQAGADFFDGVLLAALLVLIGIGINWICQSLYRFAARHNVKLSRSKWHPFLSKNKLGSKVLMIVPGVIIYILIDVVFGSEGKTVRLLHRLDIVYMLTVCIVVANSLLLSFLDYYSTTEKSRNHPLQSLIQGLQVIVYFIGAIIAVAVLIDRSPAVLLTGLGASAAVLMLIFKDSILGFVAGVQLSQNKMVRIGDWIQMPDGSANGTVKEITLNTVKVRNWDNTISMIPPYTLVSSTFKNWRGMQESGGRRADKRIFIDLTSLEVCSADMIQDIGKAFPILEDYLKSCSSETLTNIQIYRAYIELYLKSSKEVNQSLDLIITQNEATAYGLPIEVYFFLRDKDWAIYERKQSDIFDHLMAVTPEFGLKLYQRP